MNWPRFKSYIGAHGRRVALPLGGIGTGTISLGGRGDWRDFELVNRPAKGFTPPLAFFALRTQTQTGEVFCRALEGPIPFEDFEGSEGCPVANHGLPRFGEAVFHATYPLGEVELRDSHCPLQVTLQAFNPFVPGDLAASSFPLAVARFVLHNPTEGEISASIAGSLPNFIGTDGTDTGAQDNENRLHASELVEGTSGCSRALEEDSPFFGSLALGMLKQQGVEVSRRLAWARLGWNGGLLDFWDDFSSDGVLEEREREGQSQPTMSVCARVHLSAGETRALTFLLAWHFPNRLSWSPGGHFQFVASAGGGCAVGLPVVGNFYANKFADAWSVLEAVAPQLPDLEERTVGFARAFYESDLPVEIREAAGFNLSTLRTQTLFQTPDGHFFGWEGIHDRFGSCAGNCTHVWNYEQATPFLFGEMARDFRETEFRSMTNERGAMIFRVGLPLDSAATQSSGVAAADGQMGCLMKLLREWKLSGDTSWLRKMWPAAKKTLEWCWVAGGWDADRDGVMEGCQHNTMDVEYFGPNPQMQGWYLGALRAGEEMARALGESNFAEQCQHLFQNGARWTDENLWNGDYYEQQIRPATSENIALFLRQGSGDVFDPPFQLGAGCLVDQLVGEVAAHVCDLGALLDPGHVRQTLRSVLRFNRRDGFLGHFNSMRSFVVGDERGLLMASFPRGQRPARPFPYFPEVMTGFEHIVAAHLLFVGEDEAGLEVVRDIRARYDGRKRNPFDEAECGHHYARAMASWTHVLAWTGFDFDARCGRLRFKRATRPQKWFWSNGSAWGTIEQTPRQAEIAVELTVLGGELRFSGLILGDLQRRQNDEIQLARGESWRGEVA